MSYLDAAQWWRKHAEQSASPATSIEYAENLERLAADMQARPRHYRLKPAWFTDYQWMTRNSDGSSP